MPSDRGRPPERVRFGYTGVVAQQGRVILDRDFNAQQTYTADRIAADALDFVGPWGTPDDGFRISLPGATSPPPAFWSPPGGAASPPETPGGADDFLIGPGTMYLGGQRAWFAPEQNGKPITYSYFDQPDWPAPEPDPAAGSVGSPPHGKELVYLYLEEQEVSAVEDPDLLEVALGGPDTTQRLKLLQRVRRLAVAAADCETAWNTAVADWAAKGLTLNPNTNRLTPAVRLKVGFTTPLTSGDLCDPVTTGGYLGNDNQLIRVRIDRSNNGRRVLWGYDDASFLYRVVDEGDGMTLTLAADPPDAFHFPRTGQWVEILTTAAILALEPDESNPTQQAEILRVAAAATGQLCQVKQFGPQPGGIANVLTIDKPVPKGTRPLFVRVWQAAQAIPASGTVTLQTTEIDTTGATVTVSTGLTVTFSPATATALTDGTFWQFAVRPATPQGVYPEDLLVSPQTLDGPGLWACPLAVIDWDAKTVTDCRNAFDNLVTLTRRKPGCCTVSITPREVTATTSLQTLIDRAMRQAVILTGHPSPTVTVCLSAGEYVLPRTLYLEKQHTGLTLEACGGAVVLSAVIKSDMTPFTDGLIALIGVPDITLRGLELRPPVVESTLRFYEQLLALLRKDGFAAAARILQRPFTSFGVHARNAPRLTLDRCTILLEPDDTSAATTRLLQSADFFAAAVFLRGNCVDARIVDCNAGSTIPPTYTPLTAKTDVASPAALATFRRIMAQHFVVPSSPPAAERAAVAAGGSPPLSERAAVAAGGSPPLSQRVAVAGSSPPLSERAAVAVGAASTANIATIETEAEGALDLLVAKRLAGDLTAPKYGVVTVGVLAAPTFRATCLLGEALVRDCAFGGFTFGTWFAASFASLRLRDNSISDGVAGLWLEVPNASDPTETGDVGDLHQTTVQFEEYQLLVALAAAFPVPTPPSTAAEAGLLVESAVTDAAVADAPIDVGLNPSDSKVPAPFSLMVTGNQVDVRQQTETIGASAALRLALYREQANQLQTSVIVSSNRFSGGMAGGGPITQGSSFGEIIPAALITLLRVTPCSITGNVVINRGVSAVGLFPPTGVAAPSLWLVVSDAVDGVAQLAVTGNVLQGVSDLAALRRLNVKTADTWLPFNADPA